MTTTPILPPNTGHDDIAPPPPKRRASGRKVSQVANASTNPNENPSVLDAPEALRASPDAEGKDERLAVEQAGMDPQKQIKEEEPLVNGAAKGKAKKGPRKDMKKEAAAPEVKSEVKTPTKRKDSSASTEPKNFDPEADDDEEAGEEEIQAALSRPPPVHSDYLPLPWKGRLGYVCSCPMDLSLYLHEIGLSKYLPAFFESSGLQF